MKCNICLCFFLLPRKSTVISCKFYSSWDRGWNEIEKWCILHCIFIEQEVFSSILYLQLHHQQFQVCLTTSQHPHPNPLNIPPNLSHSLPNQRSYLFLKIGKDKKVLKCWIVYISKGLLAIFTFRFALWFSDYGANNCFLFFQHIRQLLKYNFRDFVSVSFKITFVNLF